MAGALNRSLSIAAILLVGAAGLGCFLLNRAGNRMYAEEGPWVVAEYAEPYRTALVLAALATLAILVWRAGSAAPRRRALRWGWAALAALITVALCVEAGMAVRYHPVTGDFVVGGLPWERVQLQLPATPDGVCVQADTSGAFIWRLNGQAVHPRLLPLPLEATEVRSALARASGHRCQ